MESKRDCVERNVSCAMCRVQCVECNRIESRIGIEQGMDFLAPL